MYIKEIYIYIYKGNIYLYINTYKRNIYLYINISLISIHYI